jgi:hypothetical protein
MTPRRACPIVLFAALLTGCAATPDPVLQLAERTGANAGVLGAQLDRLSRESKAIADARADAIASLQAANAELRAAYEFDLLLTKKSGQAQDLNLIETLGQWHQDAEAVLKNTGDAQSKRKSDLLGHITTLDTKSDALKAVAQRLAKLAEADKPQDRARFLAGFARQVRDDAKKQLEEDNPSSKSAKQLLKNASDALQGGKP